MSYHFVEDKFSLDILWLSERPSVFAIGSDVRQDAGSVVRHFDPVARRIKQIAVKGQG